MADKGGSSDDSRPCVFDHFFTPAVDTAGESPVLQGLRGKNKFHF
ncbi:hypothetical protein C4K23_2827 [Pseudomonas chlororaphis]|nr:hypothetical protein C4K23_2827 [Pseudomonas chlororaphis]